ncbi:hypothetical protein AURDEDRAFT_170443 [Auricularia subglabra TFB-10046 SS5]|nr:hypothetical protein AURDEDRAFT_170443 [Auricularia subglabra TFB-10046 SS5]
MLVALSACAPIGVHDDAQLVIRLGDMGPTTSAHPASHRRQTSILPAPSALKTLICVY